MMVSPFFGGFWAAVWAESELTPQQQEDERVEAKDGDVASCGPRGTSSARVPAERRSFER